MAFQFESPIRVLQWIQPNVKSKAITELAAHLDGDGPEEIPCHPARTLVLAGHGRTRGDGYWEIHFPSILCKDELNIGQKPWFRQASVTVTPIVERGQPVDCIAAVVLRSPPGPYDGFGVQTSFPGGGPKGHAPFSWHAVVEID